MKENGVSVDVLISSYNRRDGVMKYEVTDSQIQWNDGIKKYEVKYDGLPEKRFH